MRFYVLNGHTMFLFMPGLAKSQKCFVSPLHSLILTVAFGGFVSSKLTLTHQSSSSVAKSSSVQVTLGQSTTGVYYVSSYNPANASIDFLTIFCNLNFKNFFELK